MLDIITYIPDLSAFRAEAKNKVNNGNPFFHYDEKSERITYKVNQIPVRYSADGVKSLCLIRLITQNEIDEFNSLSSCEKIGECINGSYVFDEGGKEIYDSVYDRSPILVDGEEYTPPETLGTFF